MTATIDINSRVPNGPAPRGARTTPATAGTLNTTTIAMTAPRGIIGTTEILSMKETYNKNAHDTPINYGMTHLHATRKIGRTLETIAMNAMRGTTTVR